MNLNDINGGVVANHKQDNLLLAEPKKQEPVLNKVDKKEEVVDKKQFNDYYAETRKESNQVKNGSTTTSSTYTSKTTTTTNSSYGSYGSSNKYGSTSTSTSKVGLYGGGNLNYNERINSLRKKSKEIAKKEKAIENGMVSFEGEYKFTLSKSGKIKKKAKKFFKGKKFFKQILISVATICLEVALGTLISSAKVAVEKITDEVKNAITRKEVVVNVA